jgi:para-nitrobenzyl esterase
VALRLHSEQRKAIQGEVMTNGISATTSPFSLPRVQIAEGELEGKLIDGVRCFTGVPYAAPPTGDLRFRAPRPVTPWKGVRAAVDYGPPSYQLNQRNRERVKKIVADRDPGLEGVPSIPPAFAAASTLVSSSEDCLYLDVYVPEVDNDDPLPVYVYYHGGANRFNSASGGHDYQRGERLARAEKIIVVQPQYRLGALGWVHFGLIDPQMDEAVNLGLQDQIAALRWASKNIAAFGGDQDNITIGGESAGATAVSHMIIDPETRRYARRAILQSLTPFGGWCTLLEPEARAIAGVYQTVLGAGRVAAADPDDLLAMQDLLLRLFHPDAVLPWRVHGPVVDGNLVADQPVLHLAEKGLDDARFEVMIGFAKDEWQFFRGHTPTLRQTDPQTAVKVLREVFGQEGAQRVYDGFASAYPNRPPAHLLSDVLSFIHFKLPSLEIARTLARQGNNVYVFQYSYDHPGLDGYLRALHTGTLPFVFRAGEAQRPAFKSLDGADFAEVQRLAADFGALYGQYIRNGDPGSLWERFDADAEPVLWFGLPLKTHRQLARAELDAFAAGGITRTRELEDRMLSDLRRRLPDALARLTGR